ncbi:MAG: GNAT family N-acetyltransferase [Clostridiales bacterium]|jgi:aminoglycoside 6'-N-acetyltransferase I|nr:GNAT family N-acetyltransferase [Clostridiales bacterium]
MMDRLNKDNFQECARLAYALWPDTEYHELLDYFKDIIDSDNQDCFLYYEDEDSKEYIGFAQASLRFDYVEGSDSSPVVYIEGIYVDDNYRRKGIAQKLVKCVEDWGKDMGCSEIASDCELDNNLSINFHKSIGFEEANRLVCFIKRI